MSLKVLAARFGLDPTDDVEAVAYCGDSENDAPMFGFFAHTIGMSTVRQHLASIPVAPAWVTAGPGGEGFVEAAKTILLSRHAL